MLSLFDDINNEGDDEDNVVTSEEDNMDEVDLAEIDKYLTLPQLPYSKDGIDLDILDWWRVRKFDFPHLAEMARQFLVVPASSAWLERLFHTVGRMHDDLKKATHEETLGLVLEVHQNL